MTPQEMATLCDALCGGNVSKFVDLVGITRTAYYRSLKADAVHELTAYKIRAAVHDLQVNAERLDAIENRLTALESRK